MMKHDRGQEVEEPLVCSLLAGLGFRQAPQCIGSCQADVSICVVQGKQRQHLEERHLTKRAEAGIKFLHNGRSLSPTKLLDPFQFFTGPKL